MMVAPMVVVVRPDVVVMRSHVMVMMRPDMMVMGPHVMVVRPDVMMAMMAPSMVMMLHLHGLCRLRRAGRGRPAARSWHCRCGGNHDGGGHSDRQCRQHGAPARQDLAHSSWSLWFELLHRTGLRRRVMHQPSVPGRAFASRNLT